MTNNCNAPLTKSDSPKSTLKDAETVFWGQRLLVSSIFCYICSMTIWVVANVFMAGPLEQPVLGIVLGLMILMVLSGLISACAGIFRMGEILFPGSRRYLYTIGILVPPPLIGLIIMYIAHSNANGYLRVRGYDIGFFGAKR